MRASQMRDMVPKQRSPLVEGFCSERAVSADETVQSQTVLALGIGNPPPHRVSQRVPDESRCAALCEVVHARGCSAGSQSACELCDSDDLVQAPAHSWAFVHQHRPGRYAGRLVRAHIHTHCGTPPSSVMCAIYPEEWLLADQCVVAGTAAASASATGPQAAAARRVRLCRLCLCPCLSAGALRAGRHGSRCSRTLFAALANVMMEALAQYTHGVKDGSEDMLAKNHRAGGAGAGHGCGAGVSSELTAVLKHRPMAKPPYFSPMHTAPDFPVR